MAKWADRRRKSQFSFTRELFAMGDFNLPKNKAGDPIFDALTKLGLELPDHSSQIGSSIASDNHFDQIAYFPATASRCWPVQAGIFDYDGAIFPDLWATGTNVKNFSAYLSSYISDHRPMWLELKTS